MSTSYCYTPEYVNKLQGAEWNCQCAGCEGVAPLIAMNWKNQARISALIQCRRVAAELLLQENAFNLFAEEIAEQDVPALDEHIALLNQACINVLTTENLSVAHKLYVIALLVSKAGKVNSIEELSQFIDEMMILIANGSVVTSFEDIPVIESYKLPLIRELFEVVSNLSGVADIQMPAMLKINEFQILSDSYLSDEISALPSVLQTESQHPEWQPVWINMMLYHCFHDVFPGEDESEWQKNILKLCKQYFTVNMTVAVLEDAGECVSREMFAELLVATSQDSEIQDGDLLLIGLSLLK